MNYFFWNTNKINNINETLSHLIIKLSCDIVGLAEYSDDIDDLLSRLRSKGHFMHEVPQIGCTRIHILTKYDSELIDHFNESTYYTIKRIPHDTLGYHFVAFVHLPSKLHKTSDDIVEEIRYLKSELESIESSSDNDKSLIFGDFNMNPFEEKFVAANGAHSISCRNIVSKRKYRVVQNRKYTKFYNPMWNLLGDTNSPPGTYYYDASGHVSYYWNIFDQVVMRSSIVDYFDLDSLKIIDRIDEIKLVNDLGIPSVSDHLPIYFKIGG